MNTHIQPQIEIELTDEQLANVSGGFGHEHGRGHWGDDDDRRGRRWDNDRRWGHRDCDDDDRRWHPRWHPRCNW
jgi:bacteriocin-like protein